MIQTMKNLEQRCDWFVDKKSCATARGRDVVAIYGGVWSSTVEKFSRGGSGFDTSFSFSKTKGQGCGYRSDHVVQKKRRGWKIERMLKVHRVMTEGHGLSSMSLDRRTNKRRKRLRKRRERERVNNKKAAKVVRLTQDGML